MGLFTGKRPHDLGVKNGSLKAPPSTPNAVSSQATDDDHRIAPLVYQGTREQARATLQEIVRQTPRTRIVEAKPDYLYVEYTSALVRYVDDVEFYFPPEQNIVHVRSASRLGRTDFGVNRARIETIRSRFAAAGA